ncbi:MAG TPA: hypothetical protein PKH98_05390, partial [Candidatus Omnitrophota bacterium]|nr:hypothetical protein [Candidatus Omnitrophota bacterium]
MFPVISFAAENIEAILDTNNGTSQFSVMDSDENVVAAIDSLGRMMKIQSLGIGTSEAQAALHIDAGTSSTIAEMENDTGSKFHIFILGATPENALSGSPGDLSVDPTNGSIYIKNTGIGTTTGWQRLAFIVGSVGSVANNQLSNLDVGNVAINASLIPGVGLFNIGTVAHAWDNLYAGALRSDGTPLVLDADNGTLEIDAQILKLSTHPLSVELNNSQEALIFDQGTFSIDTLNKRIGIGTLKPESALQVMGGYVYIGEVTPRVEISQEGDLQIERNLAVGGTIFGNIQGNVSIFFKPGSVVFAGVGGVLSEDNANFFWDYTNDRLGIGTSEPQNKLDVGGNVIIGSTFVSGQK